ncbi:MAG TPA: hypothetical protein EYN79_04525 [Planctomycetes bacterium]|nr:hypothetical protein [Planctomycetota bacterium]
MANPLGKEELDFVRAIENYKKENDKLFLSWTEVLRIVKDLGYFVTARSREKAVARKAARVVSKKKNSARRKPPVKKRTPAIASSTGKITKKPTKKPVSA